MLGCGTNGLSAVYFLAVATLASEAAAAVAAIIDVVAPNKVAIL
jgi:hypothetical protein